MNDELKPGVRVTHPVFGMGTVRAVSGSGPDARITVDFAGGVGQKKLLASLAKLQVAAGQDTAPAPDKPSQYWYEILEVYCAVRPGRRPFIDRNIEHLRQSIERPQFWLSVRERLRDSGNVPVALDSLDGRLCALIERTDAQEFRIVLVVRHDELIRIDDLVITRAAFEVLATTHLEDYTHEPVAPVVGLQQVLEEDEYGIHIQDDDPGPLPDRDPKRRPIREQPKGVIRNRMRRRDDY